MGVYPNPARSKATLFVGTADVSPQDVRLVDINGKVFTGVSVKRSSTQTIELNLAPLLNGIYFVRVNIGGTTKLFKVEKF